MSSHQTVVHITREATQTSSEIGRYVEGLFSSSVYRNEIRRSILIGPLAEGVCRLKPRFDPNCQVLYSSLDHIDKHPFGVKLAEVESKFGVSLIYGHREYAFGDRCQQEPVEFVLVGVSKASPHPVNGLKGWMFEEFGLQSDRHESQGGYEQSVRMAPAALAVLRAIGASTPSSPAVLIAHDYVGIPTVLGAILDPLAAFKTVYMAHRVLPISEIVQQYPGHDCMFYNAMKWGRQHNYYLSELFGSQESSYSYALLNAARYCDCIFTISHQVKQELEFLGPHFQNVEITPIYKGISPVQNSHQDYAYGRVRLMEASRRQCGFEPDTLISHVTDLDIRRGTWRDLGVIAHLDKHFGRMDRKGVFFLVNSFEAPHYDHRDFPDTEEGVAAEKAFLTQREEYQKTINLFRDYVDDLNQNCGNIQTLFLQQKGDGIYLNGSSEELAFDIENLNHGTDVLFLQGIYEPFANQSFLAGLARGAIGVISDACGCCDYLESHIGKSIPNVIVADYTQMDSNHLQRDQLFSIGQSARDRMEEQVGIQVAQKIARNLLGNSHSTQSPEEGIPPLWGRKLYWDHICRNFFLPAIQKAYHKRRVRQIA